jgi:hypothetical protein
MAKTSKSKFDPEAFLAKMDGGVTISKYGNGGLEVHTSLLDAVLHEKPQIKMPDKQF